MEEALHRQIEVLTALHATALDITTSHDLPTLLQTIVERAAQLLDAPGGGLYLCDTDRQEVRCVVSYNTPRDYTGTVLKYGEGAAGTVVQTGEPLIVDDYRTWPGRAAAFEEEQPFVSVLSAPMNWQDQVIGVIHLVHDVETRYFTGEDLELLSLFANQAAITVENARLLEAEREQRRLAEALRETGAALSATLDFDTILDRLLDQIAQVVPYDAANVMLIEEGCIRTTRMRGYKQFGEQIARDVAELSLPIAQTANLRWMAETGEPVVIPDTAADSQWVKVSASDYFRSWAGAPIIIQGEVAAFFSLDKVEPGFYQPEHAVRLAAFAGQAALALQNARLFEAAQRRAEEAETLRQAGAVVAATLRQAEMIDRILEQLERVVPYDSASVQLLRDDYLEIVGGRGRSGMEIVEGLRFPVPGNNPNTKVIQERQPHIVGHAPATYPSFKGPHTHIQSWLGVPLIIRDQVIGMLTLHSTQQDYFISDHARLAIAFAQQAVIAIENARLYQTERRRATQLAAINAIGKQATILEPERLFQAIVRAIREEFGYYRVGLHLVDHAAQETIKVAAAGLEAEAIPEGYHQAFGEGMIGRVAQTGERLLARDLRRDPNYLALHQTAAQSALTVPVKMDDELVAVLNIEADWLDAFDEEDVMALDTLSDQLAMAIKNARLYEATQRQAITDGLTELYNVRYLYQALEEELARSRRYGHCCSLIMLDLDDFKKYNDRYGHLAGDDLLRELAGLIRDAIRQTDRAARYGGEEFVVILPETDGDRAQALAERLRERIRNHKFVVREDQRLGRITVSVGVATYPEACTERSRRDARDAEGLVQAADMALLQAKEQKDRVCVASGADPH